MGFVRCTCPARPIGRRGTRRRTRSEAAEFVPSCRHQHLRSFGSSHAIDAITSHRPILEKLRFAPGRTRGHAFVCRETHVVMTSHPDRSDYSRRVLALDFDEHDAAHSGADSLRLQNAIVVTTAAKNTAFERNLLGKKIEIIATPGTLAIGALDFPTLV